MNEKKICVDCKKKFYPKYSNHERCYHCWLISVGRCVDCREKISIPANDPIYCKACYEKYHCKVDSK